VLKLCEKPMAVQSFRGSTGIPPGSTGVIPTLDGAIQRPGGMRAAP